MNLFTEKRIMDMENRFVLAKGQGLGAGWIESSGLIDANYYIYNGWTIRAYCIA